MSSAERSLEPATQELTEPPFPWPRTQRSVAIRLRVCAAVFSCCLVARGQAPAEQPSPAAAPSSPPGAPGIDAGATDTANPGGPTLAASAPALQPPVLLQLAPAEYPAAARAERRPGRVGLRLTVDPTGKVSAAEVTQPAGYGFDEAARAAALRFVFAPARRGETQITARILYTYVFEPTPLAPVETPPSAAADGAPVSAPPAAAPLPEPALPAEVEVTVNGGAPGRQLEQSAQAVHVLETEQAQRQSADLGEVLARSEGVGVRRSGGLGSTARFSLNGLTDDQIRFFLDGLPLALSGYPFGIANVPVNLIERVEIYRGVVPVRFGADALGGAVNLVSDESVRGTHGSASYQSGSFGTQRLTLGARHLDEPSGLFLRVGAFADGADNDYPIDVEVPDERGRLSAARVRRYHDAYRALGANLEAGVVERPWAKRLLLRTFATDYDKELQHNLVMTVPYGEVEYGETSVGAVLAYEQALARQLELDLRLGYTYGRLAFKDTGACVYSWFGQCVRQRAQPGEIQTPPRDQLIWDHTAFGRLNLGFLLHPQHVLRLGISPSFTTRNGDERRQADPTARDPLTARRDLLTWVNGVEYQLDALDERLENIAFVKQYMQLARSEEPVPGGLLRDRNRNTHRLGLGEALRYRLLEGFYAKASYEYATRLPTPDEVFGDAVLIIDNLELSPEVSHNLNLGASLDTGTGRSGNWQAQLSLFLRDADKLIVLLGNDRVFSYQNVYSARSEGVEAAVSWTAPGGLLELDGNATYQSFRNTSAAGTFGDFEGDRIPNRPYFFANGSARLSQKAIAAARDELSLSYDVRYVHEFYRGWESVGLKEFKQVIDAQITHGAALSYLIRGDELSLSFSGEISNLSDAKVFDDFGVQRPGRATYFKTTAEF
jgi:vitamin B12 transporter